MDRGGRVAIVARLQIGEGNGMRLLHGTIVHLTAAATLPLLLALAPARAQQPTSAQISAISSSCRSDFMANCAGVQPGTRDALQCLQRNVAKLTPVCKSAVAATMPAPAPAHPAAAPPPPAPAPAAPPPAPAAEMNHPAPAPASGPAHAEQPPAHAAPAASEPHSGAKARRPSPARAVKQSPAAAEANAPAPAPEQTVAPLHVRPFIMPQRRVIIVGICAADLHALCAGVPPGGERVLKCLAAQAGRLSRPCYNAIARVSRD
jgi:hypothetical protein